MKKTFRAGTELFPSLHLTFNPAYYLRKHPLSTRCVPSMVPKEKGYRDGGDSPIFKELLVEAHSTCHTTATPGVGVNLTTNKTHVLTGSVSDGILS